MIEYTPEEIAKWHEGEKGEDGITRYDARTKPHYWIYAQGVEVWNRWGENRLNLKDAEITSNIKKYCGADKTMPSPNDEIDFRFTIWNKVAHFKSATFKRNVDFSNAIFMKNVDFFDATFTGVCCFVYALFGGNTDFFGARFMDNTDFLNATFMGNADLRNATFMNISCFMRAKFKGSTDFFGANFSNAVRFNGATFEMFPPYIEGAKIEGYIHFSANEKHFPKYNHEIFDAEDIASQYSILKTLMRKMEFADKELFFHGKELEAKYYNKKEPRRLRALYGYYGAFSNYGQSILRPLIGLGLTIFAAFLAFYFHTDFFAKNLKYAHAIENEAIYSAFYYTFPLIQSDTVLHDLAFDLKCICRVAENNSGCAKWFSAIRGVQSIISLFWLFLIGLGLRNNLRMR
jgi:hypothetical protein